MGCRRYPFRPGKSPSPLFPFLPVPFSREMTQGVYIMAPDSPRRANDGTKPGLRLRVGARKKRIIYG